MESEFSNTLSNLPYDIIINICSLLPANSIGRFRCVSKSWRDFLSTPYFIKTHLARTRNSSLNSVYIIGSVRNTIFTILSGYCGPALLHLFNQVTPSVKSFTSSALICGSWTYLCSLHGLVLARYPYSQLVLINPTTKEIRTLPTWTSHIYNTIYGIAYDSRQDDYKVVLLVLHRYFDAHDIPIHPDIVVRIYSVNNGTWKECETSSTDIGRVLALGSSGPYLESCIHYLVERKSDKTIVIAAFNIEEEKFYEMPVHSSLRHKDIDSLFLMELGGCICICSYQQFDIWMMKEYRVEKSWVELVSFDPKGVKFMPLCLLGQENLIFSKFVVERFSEELVTYNLKAKTFKDLVVQGVMCDFINCISFDETVISPYGNLCCTKTPTK